MKILCHFLPLQHVLPSLPNAIPRMSVRLFRLVCIFFLNFFAEILKIDKNNRLILKISAVFDSFNAAVQASLQQNCIRPAARWVYCGLCAVCCCVYVCKVKIKVYELWNYIFKHNNGRR